MTLELIKSEALKLKRLEQLTLIQAMLDEIAREEKDMDEIAEAQIEEVERRLARFEAGETQAIPGDIALNRIAKKHGLHLPTPSRS